MSVIGEAVSANRRSAGTPFVEFLTQGVDHDFDLLAP